MRVLKLIILAVFASSAGYADESQLPEPFRGEQHDSPLEVNYVDWSFILRNTVIGASRSGRGKALRGSQGAPTGSRLSARNKKDTRNDGNRINLKILAQEENVADLTKIRKSLEAVPSEVPMKHWKKEEQVAYWLNLYNITVVEQLALEYPTRRLRSFKNSKKSIWTQKLLNVAGVPLSLNDIQHIILPNKWENTLFIYGLYQGYIGGPSIQKRAFTGKNVTHLLTRSAREFVNSNRGMKARGSTLKVSEFYKENESLFPNWENDLKAHIAFFTDPHMKPAVEGVKKVKTLRMDYNTTDLYGGGRVDFIAQSNNPAAMLFANSGTVDGVGGDGGVYTGASAATSILAVQVQRTADLDLARIPADARDYLANMLRQNAKREGDVVIEPVKNGETKEDSNQ